MSKLIKISPGTWVDPTAVHAITTQLSADTTELAKTVIMFRDGQGLGFFIEAREVAFKRTADVAEKINEATIPTKAP